MSTEFIQSSVYLTKNQKVWVNEHYVNLSRLARDTINNLMKKSEGHVLKDKPTDETCIGDLTVG